MIEGFQGYLIKNGFKRSKTLYPKYEPIEDNDSLYVSTFGPTEYKLERDGIVIYWGLGLQGRSPYYFLPKQEHRPLNISDDYELEMNKLLNNSL